MSDLRGRFGSSLPLFSEHISWLRPKPFRRHRNKSATERRHATDAFGSEHPLDAQRAVAWRSQRTTVASAAMAVLGAQQVPGEDEPNARNAPGEAGSALCFTRLGSTLPPGCYAAARFRSIRQRAFTARGRAHDHQWTWCRTEIPTPPTSLLIDADPCLLGRYVLAPTAEPQILPIRSSSHLQSSRVNGVFRLSELRCPEGTSTRCNRVATALPRIPCSSRERKG